MIPKSAIPGEIINEGEMPVIEDRNRAAGAWSPDLLSGQPTGWFTTRLLQRAGVPPESELWSRAQWVHASEQGDVPRLPTPFPPENWTNYVERLQTVGDWLDLIDAANAANAQAQPSEASQASPENCASIFTDSASHSGVRRAQPPADPSDTPPAEPVVQETATASPEEPPAE